MRPISLRSIAKHRTFRLLVSFVCLAFVVMLLAPRSRSFQYLFSSGKPWSYDLITAPYDFPIYKSAEQLQMEQDSIRQETLPVYTFDRDLMARKLNQLHDNYEHNFSRTLDRSYYLFLTAELRTYYTRGIIQAPALSSLREENRLEVMLLGDDNVLARTPVTQFYSLKEVYDMIFDKAQKSGLQRAELQKLSVASYLEDNVRYDKNYSEKVLADALASLSTSTGMVQQGERIIGRGEIVTPHTYNILRSLRIEEVQRLGGDTASIFNLGLFLYVALLLSLLGIYLSLFCKQFLEQSKNVVLLLVSIFLFVALTELQARSDIFPIQVVPYVILLILLRTFFGSHLAWNTYLITILVSAYFYPADPLSFLFIQLAAGFTALFALQSLPSRGQIIRAAFTVFLVYVGSSMIVEWGHEGTLTRGYWIQLFYYGVNLIFLMFSYILAFVVERIFGYVSNIRLVELSDTNMPLLQELSEVAPGTFQHSYQVSILATAAASKVGADTQLVRTGALYHDIGKMLHPEYFTENSPAISLLRRERTCHHPPRAGWGNLGTEARLARLGDRVHPHAPRP